MNDNICANCIHEEVCGECYSVTQDACILYEDDDDWIKADVLQEIRQEIENEYNNYHNRSEIWTERACGLASALEIIDNKIKEVRYNNDTISVRQNDNQRRI